MRKHKMGSSAPGILGKKLGMTQFFEEDGTVVPVTVIEAGPCRVLQVKVKDVNELPEERRTAADNRGKKLGRKERLRRADGYYAVQLGFGLRHERNCKKPSLGHSKKAGLEGGSPYFVRELRWDSLPPYAEGQDLDVSVLEGIDKVDITGMTKGRGWTGTIKRWNFQRQPMSHGTKKCHRHVGGTGRTYSTAKGIPKGKKSAGHYGVEKVSTLGLQVVGVDKDRNLLFIKGNVPGPINGHLVIRQSKRSKLSTGKKS